MSSMTNNNRRNLAWFRFRRGDASFDGGINVDDKYVVIVSTILVAGLVLVGMFAVWLFL